MRTLDSNTDFNVYVLTAVNTGMLHVSTGQQRVSSKKLLTILANKLGQFQYRHFHHEILNRAYGLAFINQKKMAWVAAREAKTPQ